MINLKFRLEYGNALSIANLINLPKNYHFNCYGESTMISCKSVFKNIKNSKCFKWIYGLFVNNNRVATLSTLYQDVLGITIPNLKSIGQF